MDPGFLLFEADATEDAGRVYGFNLVYSGNHYAAAQQSLQGFTRVMQGINPSNFVKQLIPGESFETPEAVLCYSHEGFGGMSRNMHAFVNRHIVPQYWQGRSRPVLYNDWEGCMFDFNQHRLLDLTKAEVRDYIVESITHILDTAQITYVKWDMNRHSVALGAKAHDFVLGLYDVMGRIFRPRPRILQAVPGCVPVRYLPPYQKRLAGIRWQDDLLRCVPQAGPRCPGYEQLRLKGLKPDATYRVTSMGQALRIGQFGALLKHVVPVNINPNGALMRVVDDHFTMKDNVENNTASGAALMSGMMLRPLFRGTGYSEDQRTQGDFGSAVYVVEEITE